MKRILQTLFVSAALLVSPGCASTLGLVADITGTEIVSEKVQQQAYKAASVSFTAWESAQDGVERLGRLPRCTEAVKLLCVSQGTWDSVKAIEKKTSAALLSLKPAFEAGTDDVALLMSIPAIVHDATAAIKAETSK